MVRKKNQTRLPKPHSFFSFDPFVLLECRCRVVWCGLVWCGVVWYVCERERQLRHTTSTFNFSSKYGRCLRRNILMINLGSSNYRFWALLLCCSLTHSISSCRIKKLARAVDLDQEQAQTKRTSRRRSNQLKLFHFRNLFFFVFCSF